MKELGTIILYKRNVTIISEIKFKSNISRN